MSDKIDTTNADAIEKLMRLVEELKLQNQEKQQLILAKDREILAKDQANELENGVILYFKKNLMSILNQFKKLWTKKPRPIYINHN